MKSLEFPFISVMFAVIMGMGVVYILMAIAAIVRGFRRMMKLYWLHVAWIIFLLLLHFHVWWGLWDLQQTASWNYFTYLFLLAGPVLLVLAAAILIPDSHRPKDIDLRQFYFENNRKFFLTMTFAVIWGLSLYPVFFGTADPVFEWLLLFLIILIILSITKKPLAHVILSIIAWILFFIWVLSYGFSLGSG
jgi:hypothetical protein